MLKVVHCKKEKYDVYIGRPSKWGNPFKLEDFKSRKDCLDAYKKWILNHHYLLGDLCELEGKILGCWCKPKSCHGDILVELIKSRRC